MAELGTANIGGRAVPAWVLESTAEEMDNGIKSINSFSRPNLLDNWYFGNPVNQRGEISKSGITNGYWIDRWYLSGYDQAVEITQSGLRWTSTTGIWFTQRMDDALVEALIGRTVTISAIVNGELKTRTQKLDKNTMITCLLSDGLQRIELSAESKLFRFVSYSSPTVPLTILAAKLELGPTQTLAHKEGDKWVLNEVPDYGEQLRRCLRYCRVYKAGTTLPYLAYPQMDGGWYASAGLPTNSMRTIPTNNLGEGKNVAIVDLDGSDATHDDMIVMNWGQNGNMLCLRISGGTHGTLTSKFPYYIKLKEDLILSADL